MQSVDYEDVQTHSSFARTGAFLSQFRNMRMELALALLGLYIAFLHLMIFVERDQDSQYSDLGNVSMNKVSMRQNPVCILLDFQAFLELCYVPLELSISLLHYSE